MNKWLPIETAPKHGEAFLAYSSKLKRALICTINGGSQSWRSPGLGNMPMDNSLFPTHWMPLPDPPEEE